MTATVLEATIAATGTLVLCAIWWRRWQTRNGPIRERLLQAGAAR